MAHFYTYWKCFQVLNLTLPFFGNPLGRFDVRSKQNSAYYAELAGGPKNFDADFRAKA